MDGAPQESRDDEVLEEPRRPENSAEKEATKLDQPSISDTPQSVADYLREVNACIKQKQLSHGLDICNKALEVHPGNSKLLEKKTKVLCQLHQFQDAYKLVEEWLELDSQNVTAKREHEKLKIILNAVEGPDSDDEEDDIQELTVTKEDEDTEKKTSLPAHLKNASKGERDSTEVAKNAVKSTSKAVYFKNNEDVASFSCTTCDANFTFRDEWEIHNDSYEHRQRLSQNNAQDWHYRAPPRGLASDEYSVCKRFLETGRCTFGEKCTRAHSQEELEEWNHRYAVRKQHTYIEQLLEKLMSQEPPKMVLVENMDMVKIHVNSDLKVSMSTKKCTNAWTFTVTSKLCLQGVALMSDTHRSYFHIASISVGPRKTQKYQNLENQCQEWVNQDTQSKGQGEYVYRVKIVFKTDIYGTFRQSIIFDFGVEAILMREVQVESAPATDPEKIRKEIILSEAQRWNEKTVTLVNFEPRPVSHSNIEVALITKYALPRPDKLCAPETMLRNLSKDNYRLWMHDMLYIEEMAQKGYISRFNVTTSLQIVDRYLLIPSNLSAAKYAHGGELFARMKLEDDLSEDSMAGRLILQSSNVAWVTDGKKERPDKVYEVIIEDKGKNFIFMRLSSACVEELGLSCDHDFFAQIQFQLNRLSMCEMHAAVDRLPSLDIVFPDLAACPDKVDLGDNTFQETDESKQLNDKQKDAIRLILTSRDQKLPPLLIVGPFGTGKTYTLAQAAKQVLKQEGSRILICTHSNSAADLYIKEFLHDYVDTDEHTEARPLRVMYKFRWIQTVPEVVLKAPTVEDVLNHRVIITTLSSARYLVDLDLPKDIFSHVFIDEAAQALESETIIPLSMVHESTRIVFAGDHMQMSPEVYCDFARQQGFHTSLLERLHELYPRECVYKVMLCENYRAHAAIVDFTSELFYDNKLISSGNIVAHDQFYPLTFYAAKGEEIQHENSTGFYNMSEVYEIVERVDELKKKWPEAWGAFDNNGISIVAPYSDQVARIRAELRKRKLFGVNVERVLNIQGKQYRVIMLSITRTRLTCRSDPNVEEYMDFGFLSNIKLLNTAITRAQSLVVVVGDPVSVCLVGKCRKIWEYFLEICDNNDSLHGISWNPLKEQLDRAELTKSFVLNPLAPEFVPNRVYHTAHIQQPDHGFIYPGVHTGGWPGYPSMFSGQPFPQVFPPMFQPPVFYPYNPGLVPAMYYQQSFNRGIFPSKQMYSRFIPPGGAFSYARGAGPIKEGIPRTVEMPSSRGIRHQHPGGRHMYYPPQRMQSFPAMPQGYSSLLQPHQPPGSYFYHPTEDPRALAFAAPQTGIYPYMTTPAQFQPQAFRAPVTAYGGMPYHQGTGFTPFHMHTTLQQSNHLPHSLGSHIAYQESRPTRERSDTADSSGSARFTDSPGSGIQLLPNVKHVPSHLLGKPGNSSPEASGSSAGSPPVNLSHGSPNVRADERIAAMSNRSYSPANYTSERSGSGDRLSARSFSPADYAREQVLPGDDKHSRQQSYSPSQFAHGSSSAEDVRSSGERSLSASPPVTSADHPAKQMSLSSPANAPDLRYNNNNETTRLNTRRKTPNLRLRTGFSRQYSDGLPTPTVITTMIQMIDDNNDEDLAEGESSVIRGDRRSALKLKMSMAEKLQHQQVIEANEASSSSTPPSAEDYHPSYPRMITQNDQRRTVTVEDAAQLEIQTPRTPKGFVTPGAEVEIDPFGILKSLNIGGTSQ
ncbi:unnamed protein product [Candidula unifasciata]|uniref:C3H1-type domain-containing protein n=1 Tax=Candidula unifasciata TaxID=100452 RepID=A0A8S3ZX25_9EUPU|nr:unnamed protein product [Candidula unifasciata]